LKGIRLEAPPRSFPSVLTVAALAASARDIYGS
jgi:hypothetical protein